MSTHKYRIGQSLKFSARRMGSTEGAQYCKVVRLLPLEGSEPQYRIKCTNENVERVVKEYALSHQE
ncbi:MAG: hypothetical protein SFW09_22850 [Hyphomicrobiaceae bacterium]|nr:hypothetical protein [Hyphomicrobiaceae bacterium]